LSLLFKRLLDSSTHKMNDIIKAYRVGSKSPKPNHLLHVLLAFVLGLAIGAKANAGVLTFTNILTDTSISVDVYNAAGRTQILVVPRSCETVTYLVPDDTEWIAVFSQDDTLSSANQGYLDFKNIDWSTGPQHVTINGGGVVAMYPDFNRVSSTGSSIASQLELWWKGVILGSIIGSCVLAMTMLRGGVEASQ